jgi:prepilin-type N-terminal cleavage/methylation domain-containing protein
MRHAPRAFTLIELLVVITIIVVLLALLAPALDKAIYQAGLAVCAGGNLKTIGSSVTLYAFDHRRNYPYRSAIRHPDANWQAMQTSAPDPRPTPPPDDRVLLRRYFPINKTLNDPLGPDEVDYEDTDIDTFVFSSYGLWFGWRYQYENNNPAAAPPRVGAGMFKLGDRFSWGDERFDVLASDHDRIYFSTNDYTLNSHPDADGILTPLIWQDRDYFTGGSAGLKMTLSLWGNMSAAGQRGATDMNVATADGAVRRHAGVEWNASRSDGITRVNEFKVPNDINATWVHLPGGRK